MPDEGWTTAEYLEQGDTVVLANGEYDTIDEVYHETLSEPVTVYNFNVEDYHTYYVGEDSVLVHNACRGKLKSNMLKKGPAPGSNYQAHHGLPFKFKSYFEKAGLDINDARFGRWVRGGGNGGHQSWSRRYNDIWEAYIKKHPTADATDIIDYFERLNGMR